MAHKKLLAKDQEQKPGKRKTEIDASLGSSHSQLVFSTESNLEPQQFSDSQQKKVHNSASAVDGGGLYNSPIKPSPVEGVNGGYYVCPLFNEQNSRHHHPLFPFDLPKHQDQYWQHQKPTNNGDIGLQNGAICKNAGKDNANSGFNLDGVNPEAASDANTSKSHGNANNSGARNILKKQTDNFLDGEQLENGSNEEGSAEQFICIGGDQNFSESDTESEPSTDGEPSTDFQSQSMEMEYGSDSEEEERQSINQKTNYYLFQDQSSNSMPQDEQQVPDL